jgi:tetratricopeptide (TPR) repeat protein
MPKPLTQYRIFIGSPSGLDDERKSFRTKLERFSAVHAEPQGALFHPVSWEDTVGGVGRPQELINNDLKQCDYAVFVLHDRWGSSTGGVYTSGTEEEWAIAELLYKSNKIRNIALFFKDVGLFQLRDPGEQLGRVLAFKQRIVEEKRYLFKQYDNINCFVKLLEVRLATWLRDHGSANGNLTTISPVRAEVTTASSYKSRLPGVAPKFDYWIAEAGRLLDAEVPNHTGAMFCAAKAIDSAHSAIEWALAKNLAGVAHFHLGRPDEAILAFTAIADQLADAVDAGHREQVARALFNMGFMLDSLGRSADALAVYDDLLDRFASATEPSLREQVARALCNKGFTLGVLGRSTDAIAVYDDLLVRFGICTELPLREQVAQALCNRAYTLGVIGRGEDSIAVYDDLLTRFGTATEWLLRRPVALALGNMGLTLHSLGRSADAIAAYDNVLARFGGAAELFLREQVARALFNKAVTLDVLSRDAEAMAVYDDLLARFGAATELSLREPVTQTLVNKGFRLGVLGLVAEAIAVYDDLLARFGAATELTLLEQVAKALFNKGFTLASVNRKADAIAVYDELLARFDSATELVLREPLARAKSARDDLLLS